MTASVDYRPEVLNLTQAAIVCNVDPRTMRRWCDEGFVPTVILPNGRRAILESDLRGTLVRTHRNHVHPMRHGVRAADRSAA
jgi:predicted site-specific integrase-resolvase